MADSPKLLEEEAAAAAENERIAEQIMAQDNVAPDDEDRRVAEMVDNGSFDAFEGDDRTAQVLQNREPEPFLEGAERVTRHIAGGAARGMAALESIAVRGVSLAADPATAPRRIASVFGSPEVPDEEMFPIARGLRSFAGELEASGRATDAFLTKDQLPLGFAEKGGDFFGEAIGPGMTLGGILRGIQIARRAGGATLGRFGKTIADESLLTFTGTEILAATGESAGRVLAEGGGNFVEMLSAFMGSASFTLLAPVTKKALHQIASKFSVRIESITDQEARILAELVDEIKTPEGLKRAMNDPAKAEVIQDAAQRLQRAAGRQEDVDKAVAHMTKWEEDAKAAGLTLEDFTMGIITGNKGLGDEARRAISQNPSLAQWVSLLHAKGSKKVRDALIALGPSIRSSDIETTAQVARLEARRRIALLDEPAEAANVRANELLDTARYGDTARHGDDAVNEASLERTALSEQQQVRLAAEYDEMKVLTVDRLYDEARAVIEQVPGLGMSTRHSKAALGEVTKLLRTMGRKRAPTEWMDVIKGWSSKGETLSELLDAERNLGQLVGDLTRNGPNQNLTSARQLEVIRQGVLKDLKEFEFVDLRARDVPGTPGSKGLDYGEVGPDSQLGILDDAKKADLRAAQLAEDQRIAALPEDAPFNERRRRDLTPEQNRFLDLVSTGEPIDTPGTRGTIGQAGYIGEDSTVGLLDARTRELVHRKMNQANAAYQAMAEEFLDARFAPVTGELVTGLRRKNPAPFSEHFREYLNPNADGYKENVQDLLARAGKSVETMEAAQTYLIADAYIASTKTVKRKGGDVVALDRKALERWMKKNDKALDAFPEVRAKMKQGRDWIEEAEKVGAKPGADHIVESVEALRKYAVDPEKYWDNFASMGSERANKQLATLMATMRKAGDKKAMAGLRESFWQHKLVRPGSKVGSEFGSPEMTINTVRDVLGNAQSRRALEALYGPEHPRNLEKLAKMQDALNAQDNIPSTQPGKMQTVSEAIDRLLTRGSFFSVILGIKRRTAKIAKAAIDFNRSLSGRQRAAVVQESVKNPPLLVAMLTINPDEKIIRRMRVRLGQNIPTMFDRVDTAVELRESRKREEEAARRETQRKAANRGILATPGLGPDAPQGPLGHFNP